MTALAKVTEAQAQLALAATPRDCAALEAKASAILEWARKSGAALHELNNLSKFRIECMRKAGAKAFAEAVISGEMMSSGNPAMKLRNFFLSYKGAGSSKMVYRRHHIAALIIKAWNAWSEGRDMQMLVWRASGPKPEEFPQISKGDPDVLRAAV